MYTKLAIGLLSLTASTTMPLGHTISQEERYRQFQEHVESLANNQYTRQDPIDLDFCSQLNSIKDIVYVKSFKVEPEEAKARIDKIWEVIRSSAIPLCDATLNHPTINDEDKYTGCFWVMHLTARAGKYLEQLPVEQQPNTDTI